ncbi:PAS domain S-box-containing protein/diguanylate cyclase (GGDEF) domain-containing protein [Neptunomonas qingdaonensis]|uniref:PAS domain S-box-containing protein/diguanylate cyclase (GGDEF) domain-containing protein n=2 Tax=Neptunomonas qingdaonensis TaxID=1045558 RepID=A0A1I2U5S3_9GAMM|nr:PAS domain S-box-containing protein/diguanylate cyclase (GGDEF) domain-containing protein [Neptunomonas qingdaonensis]
MIPIINGLPLSGLTRRIIGMASSAIVLIWLIGYLIMAHEQERGLLESRIKAEQLATFFEQHTLAIFRYGDAYLKMVRREYQDSSDLDSVKKLMDEVPLNSAIASHVTIMDETGTPILVSGHSIKPGSTAKDRDYFIQQQNAESDKLFISRPHLGRNSGVLTVRLVRRIEKPDGSFGGVAFVAIKAENITNFFNTLGLGANSAATLVGKDKRILARSSYGQLGPGQDISGSRLWGELEQRPVGYYLQTSVVDSVPRVYSYRALDEFPLIVAIGVSGEDTRDALAQYKTLSYSICALASFLIIITSLLFSREIKARNRLEASEKHTQRIVDTVHGGIISINEQGIIESFSRGATETFGYSEAEIIGQPVQRLCDGSDWLKVDLNLQPQNPETDSNQHDGIFFEASATHKNGTSFPVHLAIGESEQNEKSLQVLTVRDITQEKAARRALFKSEERAQVTLQSIGDAVISTNADGIIEFLNPIAENLTGWSAAQAKGLALEKVFKIINDASREPAPDPVAACLQKGEVVTQKSDTVLLNRSGQEFAIEDSAAPIRGDQGEILGAVLVFKDVTQARQLLQDIYYQASHDALTDLINRQEFESRLQRVRETAEKEDSFNILCYIDLDQFKVINDTCGHVAGDELLRQITRVMTSCVRQRDTLGRLGGDEFGLLLERCNFDQAQRIARKMINSVREYNFAWNEGIFNVGLSVGMVAINRGSDNADELMKAADTACYTAKEKGRNRLEVFEESDEKLAKRDGETQWAIRIPRALNENRFCLYQQQIMDLSGSDEGLHYEILLRMIGEDGSMIMPASFFPAAERYKLATDIDTWVVTNVFGWLHANPEHLRRLRTCAINLSALSVSNDTFHGFVVEQLQAYDIPPEKICFEITETVAISNLSSAIIFISALKKIGCQFALDDFGSGLSSYAYLKNLPVDILKIDGMFVKDILEDKMDLATVKSINEIGHVMGHKTIAEFVENKEILEILREIGVDFAQGYGIAIPMPLSELACTPVTSI